MHLNSLVSGKIKQYCVTAEYGTLGDSLVKLSVVKLSVEELYVFVFKHIQFELKVSEI